MLKWLNLRLGLGIHQWNLEHFIVLQSKDVIKRNKQTSNQPKIHTEELVPGAPEPSARAPRAEAGTIRATKYISSIGL